MGIEGARQFPGRAAGHRHLPPGEPRIHRSGGVVVGDHRRGGWWGDDRLSRYAGGHGQPHHDDQRAGRARLGRRRDRGGGGDAGPAGLDADPRGGRLQADGRAQRGDHRDRSGADRHADAARQGRRRPVRGVLRSRARPHDARRPRDDRQHGARIWRDLRLLPDRRQDARLHAADRALGGRDRADRGLCQGAGPVAPRRRGRPRVHRHAGARHGQRGALARRPQAPAGQGVAEQGGRGVQRRPAQGLSERDRGARARRGAGPRHRRRRRGDRGDHLLHQHLQPVGAGRGRARRAQGERAGAEAQAVGQDVAGAGQPGGDRLSRQGGADDRPRRAGVQPRRLWLHDVHRQFGAARRADLGRDQRERPGRRIRPVGQPQLRGPRVAGRARQLPGVAPAGGRLCAQGHGDAGHGHDADRPGQRRRRRVSEGHLAFQRGGRVRHGRQYRFGHVPRTATATSIRAIATGRASRSRGRTPMAGALGPPISPTRPISMAWR